MPTQWLTTMKPAFQIEWLALSPKETHQVLEKINLLAQDPTPDAKVKKQLKHMHGRLHRIRCGNYRIFYTFQEPHISLLALRWRDDDTYDEDIDVEFLGGLDADLDMVASTKAPQPDWERILAPKELEKRLLPEPITEELLTNLRVSKAYFARLLPLQTQDDLLNCPGVPDEILLKIDTHMFERPLTEVMQQHDLLIGEVDDLLRFKEGELLSFLLKLSPEQEKFVNWGMNASGPVLVKGGPGTGKSTVALYRVRSLLHTLRKAGQRTPRILFTTYTNALIKQSEQLLKQLLGNDARYVEVQTADRFVMSLLERGSTTPKIADNDLLNRHFRQAITEAQFVGNALQVQAQQQALKRISADYLRQEIGKVIVARQISTLEEYLAAPRPGRKVRLNAIQRTAIWRVHETLLSLLQEAGLETWHQARARAESAVARGALSPRYDAVVIDEAQDLDPTVLRVLIGLCKSPNRLFITADANQSIYGSGFTWNDVHACLKFQGRTGVLRANYRSTREIGEAAQSYVEAGTLDSEAVERLYINNGPLPAVRAVKSGSDEVQLLARFLPQAAREFRLGLGACAVLCPSEKVGRLVAAELMRQGINATFMASSELDITRKTVKVLTLNSSKGLEFPVVALAGFLNSNYPVLPHGALDEERDEILARERRIMFVGMTRTMRALLVVIPAPAQSSLLEGFDGEYWNIGG